MLSTTIWPCLIQTLAALPISLMDDHRDKSVILHGNDVHKIFLRVIENMTILFIIIHILLRADGLLHIFFRLCLPISVHPKLSDVLPSPACELNYPFVAVQLPMMNEIECCESVIACACSLEWPKSRLLVQVLDDSTEKQTKALIDKCIQNWTDRGVQINVCRRQNRDGFKAGSLIHGMSLICQAEYIAIFDVDFLPTKDYLLRTMPILIDDPTVAFVQARWTFTNCKETFLTRMQEITLNFHHKCEQEGRFRASLFFTFNGTGGVWRRSTVDQIGGWHTDTLVEDLDLSLRAYLSGWRSVYMHDVECLNELPPTLSAYLSQQHRWISGPMQIARKMVTTIFQSRHISWYKKLYCLWYLFRNFTHLSNVISLVVMIPLSIVVMQPNIYNLICIYIFIISDLCRVAFTVDEIHLTLLHALFCNAMSLNNACAILSGLFNCAASKRWIVTPKFGSGSQDSCSARKLFEKRLSTLKRDKNVLNALHEKNMNKSYPYRLSFSTCLIKDCLQCTYQRIRRIVRSFRSDKRNFWMAVYLLAISYMAFEKIEYFIAIYMFSTSIMYFILACGYMGRQIE